MRRLLFALGFTLLCGPAFAANCTSPITGNDAGGTSRNIGTVLDASNNCLGKNTIWDYSAGANGAGVDTSHGLLVDPASAALWNTTWAGGTLGAMANYGTSPGAVLAPGVNAFVTNAPAINGAINVTPVDCSGTITTGGTPQNAFATSATRHGFIFVNLSTDPMWVSFTGTATPDTPGSNVLNAGSATTGGGSFSSPLGFGMNTALSVVAATSTDAYSCTQW